MNVITMRSRSYLMTAVVLAALSHSQARGQADGGAPRRAATPVRASVTLPQGVATRDVIFYSESIQCHGRIFLPKDFSAEAKLPAVVLAPGLGETSASVEQYAALFAARGLVAMTIDYRGWGKSGGFLQTVDPVRTDDRLRFSQMTAKVRIERKRVLPQQQVLDIRNALYYLQGEAGIDRLRVGVWGTDLGGGHVIVTSAVDARIKAAVAQVPMIDGKETPRRASAPTGMLLRAEQKRARGETATGMRGAMTDPWAQVAMSEYHPFWSADQIPAKTALLFILAEKDLKANNETATAASKLLKGPTEVITIPGATKADLSRGAGLDAAAKAAAEWFLKYL